MPLVRIDLRAGHPPPYRRAIGESVHQAMVETLNVPPLDRFQMIAEHDPAGLIYDSTYLGIERTNGIVVIQVTLNAGRSVEMKKEFYARGGTAGREAGGAARGCADQPGGGAQGKLVLRPTKERPCKPRSCIARRTR